MQEEVDFGEWMLSAASMLRVVNRGAPEIQRQQVLQAEASSIAGASG
jgi:hypothetical protein